MRTQTINQLRAQLRQEGIRLGPGLAETVVPRLDALALPDALRVGLAPLRAVLASLAPVIAAATADVGARASADPVVRRLLTVPGIGPITAVTFRAALDTWERFRDASAATAFLGLVPREDSSGTRQRKGAITKAGPGPVRALLVQAAWVVWRQRQSRAALHAWVERLAARRGTRIAVVALARRLARILFALWRDETEYQAGPGVVAAEGPRAEAQPPDGVMSTIRSLAARRSSRRWCLTPRFLSCAGGPAATQSTHRRVTELAAWRHGWLQAVRGDGNESKKEDACSTHKLDRSQPLHRSTKFSKTHEGCHAEACWHAGHWPA